MSRPFIIYGMPRSRTTWVARYLTYGDYLCEHEQTRHARSAADVKAWLSQDFTGTVETAAAPWWRLVQHYRPDIRTVVIRRPVSEVVDSVSRLDMRGVCAFDLAVLTREMTRLDAKLAQISQRVPGALSVSYADLTDESVCARVFQHCLPYRHDHAWWESLASVNIQCSMPALMRHTFAHRDLMRAAGLDCKRRILADLSVKRVRFSEGLTIQEEPFDQFWRDGQALFAEHCEEIGETRDNFLRKNVPLFEKLDRAGAGQIMTARMNGRMFGYLVSIIGPSLESPDLLIATQTTFFASRDAADMRLGLKLERAAIEAARARGVGEVYMRAGVRGSGARLGTLYRYLGAEEYGQLFKLTLKAA